MVYPIGSRTTKVLRRLLGSWTMYNFQDCTDLKKWRLFCQGYYYSRFIAFSFILECYKWAWQIFRNVDRTPLLVRIEWQHPDRPGHVAPLLNDLSKPPQCRNSSDFWVYYSYIGNGVFSRKGRYKFFWEYGGTLWASTFWWTRRLWGFIFAGNGLFLI